MRKKKNQKTLCELFQVISGQTIKDQAVVAKEVFPGQERLIKACFFLLQKRYFSCKNQFDMHTLKSAYTQASSNFRSATQPLQWTVSEVANLFANRWRRKACIKPWGSWICCLTTLRHMWLQRGTKTTPEEQLTALKHGEKKPVSLHFYWNECRHLFMSFYVLRPLLSLIVLRTSFQTILCLYVTSQIATWNILFIFSLYTLFMMNIYC